MKRTNLGHPSQAFEQRARETLQAVLELDRGFPGLRAAEAMLDLGYGRALKAVKTDLRSGYGGPIYRIVLWRIMAREANSPAERGRWTRRLCQASFQGDLDRRVHAMEALGKVGYAAVGNKEAKFRALSRSRHKKIGFYARWVLRERMCARRRSHPGSRFGGRGCLSSGPFCLCASISAQSAATHARNPGKSGRSRTPGFWGPCLLAGGGAGPWAGESTPGPNAEPTAICEAGDFGGRLCEAMTALAKFGTAKDLRLFAHEEIPLDAAALGYEPAKGNVWVAASHAILKIRRRLAN